MDSNATKSESKVNTWHDETDAEIFSKFEMVGGKYIPPQPEFLKHLDNFTSGQEFKLEWKCIGRRAPTPENEEPNDNEDDQFTQVENTIDDKDFEFEDELNQLNLSAVRRNATPKGSAKKTKATSLQSILSNIARHRKIDMLGTEDELKNKTKEEQHLQANSKQPDTTYDQHMLTDENLSQSSGSQPLHEPNLDLQTNDIESNSNSQQNEPSQMSFLDKEDTSLEEGLKHFRMVSRNLPLNSKLQHKNASPSENNQVDPSQSPQQNNSNVEQVLLNQSPQSNNLNFQNILNRTLESNETPHKVSLMGNLTLSDLQDSVHNKTPNSSINVSESNQSSQITTSTSSSSVILSHSLQSQDTQKHSSPPNQIEFDSIDMNTSEMENDSSHAELLGSDLPLPEEAKQDLSEFDFQMDE